MRSRRVQHSLYAAYLPVLQHHLDAVGVGGAVCQDAPHHAAGAPAGGLVFFKYDLHLLSGADVRTPFAVNGAFLLAVYRMRRFAAGRFA